METSRRNFLKVGLRGLAAVAIGSSLEGCATGRNIGFGSINQDIAPYDGERTTIHGTVLYIERSEERTPGTLPYTFFIFEDSIRLSNLDKGETALNLAQEYVPKLITKNGVGEIELGTSVRAKITSNRELRAREGLNHRDYNFSARTSEKDALWELPTINLFGEEFFYPHVPNKNLNDRGKLPFKLIPKRGAKVGTSNLDESIILLSNQIYRPVTEVASYTGKDLFQSDAALPDWFYYRRTPGGWFRESPDNDVIPLTNSQTGEVLRAIRKQKNNSR